MNGQDIRSLVCFERIRIGPVSLEPRKVKARYEIVLPGGEAVTKELIYSYPETVFENTPESVNMASMMISQVAMNYGLFCNEMVFDGYFDDTDKRFIMDMIENTSREIYVNKILLPNEFLIPPYTSFPPERHKRYTAANIIFVNSRFNHMSLEWVHRDSKRDSFMILSSGGKDSLLSYGLLKELGMDSHPVFINEAGRHWYTSMNAFKYLSGIEPNVSRVWCNSDRIFNWILRYMPFIRKDYATIRSDAYPVRMWTVAVFLFGVLPLARKRRSGIIIIGNEYDSTVRSVYNGITHYNGLYDQSRYFDNALTRYYTKKGWNLFQFSLLRSMSELLIMKTLASRYHHLQAHQVSCHAAHLENNRALPCGKCEKCRRIIAMLSVLGVDPENCGYTAAQVKKALHDLGNKGVRQLDTDAAHLYHMLVRQDLMDPDSPNAGLASEQPVILKLRFDRERNHINEIPLGIMSLLAPVYLQYAEGAVEKRKRLWMDIDLDEAINSSDPYPFEIIPGNESIRDHSAGYRWESHTWEEIEEKLKTVDTAILPCGSIEQHGPHLPLDVDYFDSIYLADRIAEACSDPKPLVLPAIPYGVAYHHDDFRGTISISNHSLSALVYDIGMSLTKNGIRKLIILNAHGDNAPTLLYAAQMINRDAGIFVCVESGETSHPDLAPLIETPNDIHAGEIETSTTMAIRPDMVRMDKMLNETLDFGSSYLDFTSGRGVAWFVRTRFLSGSGIMGNPTMASVEKGRKIWEITIAHLVRFVEVIKRSRPEDLYQRKY
jgi:creatinine amidohydrolase/Fe(II)-dependent formamide hydrolase-like protein